MGSEVSTLYSDTVEKLLRSLRGEIMASYGAVAEETKSDKSVVTEVDRLVEQRVSDTVRNAYPDIGVHGEELGQTGPTDRYWLVDPIDGTESYVRGLPGATTVVALVENEVVIEAFIYDFAHDSLLHAVKGKGVYKDGTPVTVSDRPVERAMLSMSSSISDVLNTMANALKDEAGVQHEFSVHGCGYKALVLASGQVEGFVSYRGKGSVWDYAPMIMICVEAGAKYIPFGEDSFGNNHFALLTPTVATQLEPIVRRYA